MHAIMNAVLGESLRVSVVIMIYHIIWHAAKISYRRLRNHKKNFHLQQVQIKLINDYFSDSQCAFWKVIKQAPAPCAMSDIDAWTDHFQHVFNSDTYSPQLGDAQMEMKRELFATHSVNPSRMAHLNRIISETEVIDAFKKLPNMKAAGADSITAECFKAAMT
jgi:hypothetical protein